MTSLDTLRDLKADLLRAELRHKQQECAFADLQLAGALRTEAETLAGQNQNRIYHFFGPVSNLSAANCIEVTGQWARRDPGTTITIVLNSPGGDITEGLAVYDHLCDLRRQGSRIKTISRGMAASMGGVVLQAGDERVMDANAFMLVHDGEYGMVGKGFEVKDRMKFVETLQAKCFGILAARSKLSLEEIKLRSDRKDWWMDAEQALEYGFIDRIEG